MGAEFECIINSLWFLAVSGHQKIWFTETESGEGKWVPQGGTTTFTGFPGFFHP